MNDKEQFMYDMIQEDGANTTLLYLIRAMVEAAHDASDLRLKERAIDLMCLADRLKEVRDKIKDLI